jgi:hypothetical protein
LYWYVVSSSDSYTDGLLYWLKFSDTTGALPWTITWSGGYNDGTNVGGAYLYVVDSTDTPWSQFGVPESISSTDTSILWKPNGITAGTYSFLIVSSTASTNYDSCDVTWMDCQIDVPITWRYIDKQIIPAMLGIMGVQLCLTAPTTYNSQFHIKPCTAAVELS